MLITLTCPIPAAINIKICVRKTMEIEKGMKPGTTFILDANIIRDDDNPNNPITIRYRLKTGIP